MELGIPYAQGFFTESRNVFYQDKQRSVCKNNFIPEQKKAQSSLKKKEHCQEKDTGNHSHGRNKARQPPYFANHKKRNRAIPETMAVADVLALFNANPEISIFTVVDSASKVIGIIPHITVVQGSGHSIRIQHLFQKADFAPNGYGLSYGKFFEPVEVVRPRRLPVRKSIFTIRLLLSRTEFLWCCHIQGLA